MPLEDATSIDLAIQPEAGSLCLLITDSGDTSDPDERFSLLVEKLRGYMGYVLSDRFQLDHADVSRDKVSIRFVSRLPATPKMLGVSQIRSRGERPIVIPVSFEVLSP